ncbi:MULTISPECIES: hypothetical protein [Streptomyces]|uniref:hypothetical protein n=1 Tax=Streptomyces TaxID=1883 RepID=UPI00136F0CD6|nr:hypothetical protein [Streptomyces sp. SID2888]MYV50509.1 hypothetical protein [Streptomyces sp. SID2888]
MNHRKPRTPRTTRKAAGLGIVATAGLALAAGTTTADASPGSSRISHAIAIAVDMAHSHADRIHVTQFDQSFNIHEYGPSVAVTANNRATAESVGCSAEDPCRSIALSYQIVTTAGKDARLVNATNISRAANEHCPSCQTLSAAYQFVVAMPRGIRLSRQAHSELNSISHQVNALRVSHLPVPEITQRADQLAREVKTVLDREAARTPRAGDREAGFRPTVTMHRHVR